MIDWCLVHLRVDLLEMVYSLRCWSTTNKLILGALVGIVPIIRPRFHDNEYFYRVLECLNLSVGVGFHHLRVLESFRSLGLMVHKRVVVQSPWKGAWWMEIVPRKVRHSLTIVWVSQWLKQMNKRDAKFHIGLGDGRYMFFFNLWLVVRLAPLMLYSL